MVGGLKENVEVRGPVHPSPEKLNFFANHNQHKEPEEKTIAIHGYQKESGRQGGIQSCAGL